MFTSSVSVRKSVKVLLWHERRWLDPSKPGGGREGAMAAPSVPPDAEVYYFHFFVLCRGALSIHASSAGLRTCAFQLCPARACLLDLPSSNLHLLF